MCANTTGDDYRCWTCARSKSETILPTGFTTLLPQPREMPPPIAFRQPYSPARKPIEATKRGRQSHCTHIHSANKRNTNHTNKTCLRPPPPQTTLQHILGFKCFGCCLPLGIADYIECTSGLMISTSWQPQKCEAAVTPSGSSDGLTVEHATNWYLE